MDERAAFLLRHEDEAPEVVAEVRALLEVPRAALERLLPPDWGATPGVGVPMRIGPFAIVGEIARGGMGIVYEAQQASPRRRVALKVLRPGLGWDSSVRRLRREAEILGQLEHPGIARVYDAGTAVVEHAGSAAPGSEQPYFAMEFVDGARLTDYCRERGLGTRAQLDLVARVCDAVHYAHEKGVVHRDLKPANILVDAEGQPKVLDFGIARVTDGDLQTMTLQTDIGAVIGTVPYMSPEQIAGDTRQVDARADVYALGVVLYELLGGRLPHELAHRSIAEAARIIRDDEPSRLGSLDSTLRGDVDTIVAKALEKDPARRYQDAAALGADLRRHLRHEPIVARPATTLYLLAKFGSRHRGLVAGLAAAALALVAGTVAAVAFALRARDERAVALHTAYRASLVAADAALQNADVEQAGRSLDGAPAALRGWEWGYLHGQLDQSLWAVAADVFGGRPLRFERGGQVVAALRHVGWRSVERKSVWSRWDAATGAPLDAVPAPAGVHLLETRDGGKRLCMEFDDDLRLRVRVDDLRSGTTEQWSGKELDLMPPAATREDLERNLPVALAVTERGDRLAAATDIYRGLVVHPLPPGRGRGWSRPNARIRLLSFSPDGSLLATLCEPGGGEVWDAETGEPVCVLQTGELPTCFDFSPDSARLATGTRSGRVQLWDARSGALLADAARHRATVTTVAFSPGSSGLLASASADRVIRLSPADDPEPRIDLLGHTARVESLAFSADGTRLASADGSGAVRVWDTTVERDDVLRGHASFVYPAEFSPDGRRVLSGGWDGFVDKPGSVRLWDAATGEPIARWGAPAEFVASAAFSPDGAWLAVGWHRPGTVGARASEGCLEVRDAWTGELRAWEEQPCWVQAVAPSPSGGRFAILLATGVVQVWDPNGGIATVITLPPPPTGSWLEGAVAWSPDGASLALAADPFRQPDGHPSAHSIALVDTKTWKTHRTLAGHRDMVTRLAFSADGARLASASQDRTVRVWDAHTGELMLRLPDHPDVVWSVAFSPDGTRLVTAGRDGLIRVFDAATGEPLLELRGHSSYVYSVAFSPDGMRLVSGSGDSTVRIWDTRGPRGRRAARDERRAIRAAVEPVVQRVLAEHPAAAEAVRTLRARPGWTPEQREVALQLVFRPNER